MGLLKTTFKIGAVAGLAYFGHAVYSGLTLRPRNELKRELQGQQINNKLQPKNNQQQGQQSQGHQQNAQSSNTGSNQAQPTQKQLENAVNTNYQQGSK